VAASLHAIDIRSYITVEYSANFCDFYHVRDFLVAYGFPPPSARKRMTIFGLLRSHLLKDCRGRSLANIYKAVIPEGEFVDEHHLADVDTKKLWQVQQFIFGLPTQFPI
jgi:hypothetical protein